MSCYSCYDTGEFPIYGRSRGPSSGAYSEGRSARSSEARQERRDVYGYPMQGGYAGEQDLRRRMARYGGTSAMLIHQSYPDKHDLTPFMNAPPDPMLDAALRT